MSRRATNELGVLIGFDPIMVTVCGVLNATYQFMLHTETVNKFPRWVEFLFNTPSHHRVHHGTDLDYLDTNYAGVLIIWDRIFGSFKAYISFLSIQGLPDSADLLQCVIRTFYRFEAEAPQASLE